MLVAMIFTHLAGFKTQRAAYEWALRAVRRNEIVPHTRVWIFQRRKGGDWLVDGTIRVQGEDDSAGPRPTGPTRILIAAGPDARRSKVMRPPYQSPA